MNKHSPSGRVRPVARGVPLLLAALMASGADCSRKPTAQVPAATSTAAGIPATAVTPNGPGRLQIASEPVSGVDDDDAPDAPRALPRSGHVVGWIKTRAVRTFAPDQAAACISDPAVARLLPNFQIERLATCQYRAGTLEVEVLLVDASPADAFGLFTVLSERPQPVLRPDGSARGARRAGRAVCTAWQGRVYIELAVAGDTAAEGQTRIDQLLDRIVFALPSAEPPLLLRVIPAERRENCRIWHVRTTRALALLDLPGLRGLNPARMDASLGLRDGATLSMAALDVVPGTPHLLWLVEYPTAQAAIKDGYHAYQDGMKSPEVTPLHKATILEAPRGRYLAGTWTREQEALQPLLPMLVAALPDDEPAGTQPAAQPAPRTE